MIVFLCLACIASGILTEPVESPKPSPVPASEVARVVDTIRASEMRVEVARLADDSFEGRGAGSRGGRAAGNYLIKHFKDANCTPLGDGKTYFQDFEGQRRNILGMVEGSDETLNGEVIMIGAHYDHVGYGNERNSYGPTGFIHNGADDNASGISALVEVMQAISELERKPARSIVFAMWDGEEEGLLGSYHWVKDVRRFPYRIGLYINMDMVGRLRDNNLEVYGTRTSLGLRQSISRANSDEIGLNFLWDFKEDSDHYPFGRQGIPAIMLHTGLHDQYHRPSDDVELINFEGAEKVARLATRILIDAAQAPDPLPFRKECFQEDEAKRTTFETGLPAPSARLGVVAAAKKSDSGAIEKPGVVISRVVAGSAAERENLKVGDRILKVDDIEIDSQETLSRTMLSAKSNVVIQVQLPNEDEPRNVEVELDGDPIRIGLSWRPDVADPGVMLISRVVAYSPADDAGLKVGDRIYRIDAQPIADSDALRQKLIDAKAPLLLEIERSGVISTTWLKIPSQPTQ
jgi:Peptidase family M28/PDZ domain